MKPDAMLFDLDGLLLNTEVLSKRAFEATSKAYEIGDETDLFLSLVGTNEDNHKKRLIEELGDRIDAVAFRNSWNSHFHDLIESQPVELLPGVIELLNYAKASDIKCAVATSSGSKAAEKKIIDAGIREYFLTITCGDQVAISKPHPEIYQKAGASVQADMTRSIGLEDSANGVRAAHAAGLQVIQIPNLVPPSDDLLILGHRVHNSLLDVLDLLKNGTAIQ